MKLIKCSLKKIHFNSFDCGTILRNVQIVRGDVETDVAIRANFCDALFLIGEPKNNDLSDFFYLLKSKDKELYDLLNVRTQVDYCPPAGDMYSSFCTFSSSSYRNRRKTTNDHELAAIVHDEALKKIFCNISAESLVSSISKQLSFPNCSTSFNPFDYKNAYMNILKSLQASAARNDDFIFVIQINPKIDENEMTLEDVVVTIKSILTI
jgi:hypothetical protein